MLNVKLAFRTALKSPFVTLVAVLSLALGIGANAALFSIFDLVLLRPLPVTDPARLVNLSAPGPKPGSNSCTNAGSCEEVFSYPMFRDLDRSQTIFTGIAAHRAFSANLSYRGQAMTGTGVLVSGGYFPVLGIQPALGRLLAPADDRTIGQSPVAVLTYSYWQTRFAASPAVLNDTLVVNGQAMTIVGVAPRGFIGTTIGDAPLVFLPITMQDFMLPGLASSFEDRRSYWAYLFARLKPGVSMQQAQTALNVSYHALINDVEAPLQKELSDQTLARFRAKVVTVADGSRGQSVATREAQAPLTLLMGVTALVLLIACANIASLLLARAATRAGEMAVRLSLGASRWQLATQLLTESSVLALAGGAVSLLVAHWTLGFMRALLPPEQDGAIPFGIDARAVAFTAAVSIGAGLLFGLFPAWHSTRPDLAAGLKGQAGQVAGARAARRFRTALATAQITLSTILLVAAGLFTKSLLNVTRADLGVQIDHIITFEISPALNGYRPEASKQLFGQLEDDLAAIPGVTGVTNSLVGLLVGDNWGQNIAVEGFDAGPDTDVESKYNEVGSGYFQTFGIPMLAGRDFTRADAMSTGKVAIVNEAFAKKFNLADPIGKHLGNRGSKLDIEIVGFVKNAKYSSVKDQPPPVFFRPYRQDERIGGMTYYVRGAIAPEQLLTQVPKVVAKLDQNLPLKNLRSLPDVILDNIFLERFVTMLSGSFAVLATLLAAIGLYGVLAYTVAQRTREIGLRMALGAAPGRVRSMVLRQVAAITLAGIGVGLAAAIPLGRLAESLLYQLKGSDPSVLASASLTLAAVAFGAGFIPAYRASRVDPMTALRHE